MEFRIIDGLLYITKNEKNIYCSSIYEVLEKDEHNMSTFINDLLEKEWLSKKDLYKLCVFIKNRYPDSNIDWLKTGYCIEKDYHDLETAEENLPNGTAVGKVVYSILNNNEGVNYRLISLAKKNIFEQDISI